MVIQKELIFPENIKFHVLLEQLNHSVFFDIETTGLSWRTSHLYLIGAAFMENGCWTLQQWFLQKPSEEKELLLQFSSFLSSFTQVIHYNGQGFDLPYLAHKYEDYRLPDPFAHMESLDLYRMVRPFRILLSLSSLKQKDVERLLERLLQRQRADQPLSGISGQWIRGAPETPSPSQSRRRMWTSAVVFCDSLFFSEKRRIHSVQSCF